MNSMIFWLMLALGSAWVPIPVWGQNTSEIKPSTPAEESEPAAEMVEESLPPFDGAALLQDEGRLQVVEEIPAAKRQVNLKKIQDEVLAEQSQESEE